MQFFRMFFTWWHSQTFGTAFFTWWRGQCVGEDEQGNKYYLDKKNQSINGKARRWVVFAGDVEASRIPPQWHGWLHYTVDEIPDSERKPHKWEKSHQSNQTGLKTKHKFSRTAPQKGEAGYHAWKPKGEDNGA